MSAAQLANLSLASKSKKKKKVVVKVGMVGDSQIGKCWGRDTPMMMFDGRTKLVQDIKEGDMLMGDDNTARTVQAGSLVRGNTAHDDAPDAATYRIDSKVGGHDSWTCNGDHILVVKFNQPPTTVQSEEDSFSFSTIAAADDNRIVHKTMSFATQHDADASRAAAIAAWQPLIWEGPVHQFLQFESAVREQATMYQPDRVDFVSNGESLHKRLSEELGRVASAKETELTAWMIGVWLANGAAGTANVAQITSNTAVVDRMKLWYQTVTGREPGADDVVPAVDSASASTDEGESDEEVASDSRGIVVQRLTAGGNELSTVKLGVVLTRMLKEYKILFKKRVPHDLLTDQPSVRQSVLAGIIDGQGRSMEDGMIEVTAQKRRLIDSVIHLSRGLGFSAGPVDETACTNDETSGFITLLGGADLPNLPTVTQHKPAKSNADHRCIAFSVTKVDHQDYFGFALDGNGRCLMGDFIVSHNTSLMVKYVEGNFNEDYIQTLGVNFMEKTIALRNTDITFSIWDLGGQQEYLHMLPLVCNDAVALLFMFDLSRKSTLTSVKNWYKQARLLNKTATPFLIGTKYDYFSNLKSEEKKEMTLQARRFAKAMKAPLIFCSASHAINIHKIFKVVLAKVFDLKCTVQQITEVGDPIIEYEQSPTATDDGTTGGDATAQSASSGAASSADADDGADGDAGVEAGSSVGHRKNTSSISSTSSGPTNLTSTGSRHQSTASIGSNVE